MKNQGGAKYTFAFAADVQKLADEKHIKVLSFRTKEGKSSKGSYDILSVDFLVPRPDRNKPKSIEDTLTELYEKLEEEETNA